MSPGPLEASDRTVLLETSSVTIPNLAQTCLVLPLINTFIATLIRTNKKGWQANDRSIFFFITFGHVSRFSVFVVVWSEKLKKW